MRELTEQSVYRLYDRLKAKASKCLEQDKIDSALVYLKAATHTAYTFYIGYTDPDVESWLKHISLLIKPKPIQTKENCVVFYDTFSQDAQGLTMQYVDAIISAGWEMLYITEFGLDDPRSMRLKQTLDEYPGASVVVVPNYMDGIKKIQMVYDTIMDFAPDKLFMHIHPDAVHAVSAFYALPQEITKFQINLTDHTYWVGAGCVDYCFEFREYGASLSAGRRGISRDRLLLLPYYPMMKRTSFQGFPEETKGKVIIFSGSSFYKIMDEKDSFFRLNKAILDANPQAVTLFAGGGDMALLSGLVDKYGLQGRFIPIGQRNDIFECFNNADIYLSTYPFFGALMAQYAAHACLPILAYGEKNSGRVEEVVCQKQKEQITYSDWDMLVAESRRLVNDEKYRRERGQAMCNCVIDIDEFNHSFQLSVATRLSQYHIEINENVVPHTRSIDDKLKLENTTKNFHLSIYRVLGLNGLFVCPQFWMDGLVARFKTSRFWR